MRTSVDVEPAPAGASPAPAQSKDAALAFMRKLRPDRSSPVPLYYQVAQHLEAGITSGQLPPGTQLDNEVQLAAALSLSRPTMRQAMLYLVDKGLIVRRRGVGTRVVQPKVRRPLELSSLYDDLDRAHQRPTTEVLSLIEVSAAADVAGALAISEGDPVTELVRLRSAGETPIAKLTNYLRPGAPELGEEELRQVGLYQLIRTAGFELHSATQVLGARRGTRAETSLLEEEFGAALLTMERTAYDDLGAPIEFGRHIYAASRYSFEMSLRTS